MCFDCLLFLLIVRKDHEKAEFEVHEVYAVDVLISTGEGKVCCFSSLFVNECYDSAPSNQH